MFPLSVNSTASRARHTGGPRVLSSLLVASIAVVVVVILGAPFADAHPDYQPLIPNGHRVFRNGVHWHRVGHLSPDWPVSRTATATITTMNTITQTDTSTATHRITTSRTLSVSPTASGEGSGGLNATDPPTLPPPAPVVPGPPPAGPTPPPTPAPLGGSLNTFGIEFANQAHNWTLALCQADTDGDGFTNGYELGDPGCVWRPGDLPERQGDITHPGYHDSVPLYTTPSFKLHGPPGTKRGVVLGRIYPRPWGTVNFASATGDRMSTAWAREFCKQTWAVNETKRARIWRMEDRPAEDLQYLPTDGYVAISDVSGCVRDADALTCAFSYSEPLSPQNSTPAHTDAIYIDCEYDYEEGRDFYPGRIAGSDPGVGHLQVWMSDLQAWVPVLVENIQKYGIPKNDSIEELVCTRIVGYNDSNVPGNYKPRVQVRTTSEGYWFNVSVEHFLAPTTFANASVEYPLPLKPLKSLKNAFATCINPQSTPWPPSGPVYRRVFVGLERGITQANWTEQAAAEFGVNVSQLIVSSWVEDEWKNLTHLSFHIDPSVAPMNPNALLLKIQMGTQPANRPEIAVNLGIIDSRFTWIEDTNSPAGLPTHWMLDGPSPGVGALKARYSPSDPWGHVIWDNIEGARAICDELGFPTPSGRVPGMWPLRIQETREGGSTIPYRDADEFISVDGGMLCDYGPHIGTCRHVYSPNTSVPRYIGAINEATWLICDWVDFPPSRIVGAVPCWGKLQMQNDVGNWTNALGGKGMPVEETCAIGNCNCSSSVCEAIDDDYWATYELLNCTAGEKDKCSVRTHEPQSLFSFGAGAELNCEWHPNRRTRSTWSRSRTKVFDRSTTFVQTANASNEDVKLFLSNNFNVSYDDVQIVWNNTNYTTDLAHFQVRVWDDNPVRRATYQGVVSMTVNSYAAVQPENTGLIRYTGSQYHDTTHPRNSSLHTPEFRIVGPSPSVGFLQFRYASRANDLDNDGWGGVFGEDSAIESLMAICKAAGQYSPFHMPRGWWARTNGYQHHRWGGFQQAMDIWNGSTARLTLSASFCAGNTMDDWEENCGLEYNEKYHHNAGNEAAWVDCTHKPFQYRLRGAFPRLGMPEILIDGEWHKVVMSDTPEFACPRYFGFLPQPGVEMTRTYPYLDPMGVPIKAVASHHAPFCNGTTNDTDPWWMCRQRMWQTKYYEQTYECVQPPAVVPFGGASITQLNAAVNFGEMTRDEFKDKLARTIGTNESFVTVSQWVHQPNSNMTHVTVSIQDPTLNSNLALNAASKNNTLVNWMEVDVRQVPVPAHSSIMTWEWNFEPDQLDRPYLGLAVARPTYHYQYGVPCAAKWTDVLSRVFCKTVFGSALIDAHPRAPTFQRLLLRDEAVRHMVVEDIICAPDSTDIATCSYGYPVIRDPQCSGAEAVLVDCMPPTGTTTMSGTATVTGTVSPPPTGTATFSRSGTSLTPSPLPTGTVSFTVTPPPTATLTPPPTRTVTKTFTAPFTATRVQTATAMATRTVTEPPTPTKTDTKSQQVTVSPIATPTVTFPPTRTMTASQTPTATYSVSRTVSPAPTVTHVRTATASLIATPSATIPPTATASATVTPAPTPTSTSTKSHAVHRRTESRSKHTPSRSASGSMSPPPTLTHAPTRTLIPPTATASSSASVPFPSMEVSATPRPAGGAPLQVGDFVHVDVVATLRHATLLDNGTVAGSYFLLAIGVGSPLTLCHASVSVLAARDGLLPQPRSIPALCRMQSATALLCNVTVEANSHAGTVWAGTVTASVAAPYAAAEHGRGNAAVSAHAFVPETAWAEHFEAPSIEMDAPSAVSRANVALVTAAEGRPTIETASPALNAFVYGLESATLTGRGLRALPRVMHLGPWVVRASPSADGRSATLSGFPRSTTSAVAAAERVDAAALVLRKSGDQSAASGFCSAAKAHRDAATLQSERRALEATPDSLRFLRRFAFDWSEGRVQTRPLYAERAPPTHPDTVAAAPVGARTSWSRVTLPTFVPGCVPLSASALATVGRATDRRDNRQSASTASLRFVAQQRAFDNVTGACIGMWATFTFPRAALIPIPTDPREVHDINAATNVTGSTTVAPPQRLAVTVTDPANMTTFADTRTYLLTALRVNGVPITEDDPLQNSSRAASRRNVSWVVTLSWPSRHRELSSNTDRRLSVLALPDTAAGTTTAIRVEYMDGGVLGADPWRCNYIASNISGMCRFTETSGGRGEFGGRRQDLASGQKTARFKVWAEVPSYSSSAVHAAVHVLADDLPGVTLPLQITPDAPATQPPAPPSDATVRSSAIFLGSSDCSGMADATVTGEPWKYALLITGLAWAAWLLLVAVRLIAMAARRLSASNTDDPATAAAVPDDAIETAHVFAMQALPRVHQYVGALVPCHRYCGVVHATTLLAHAFVIFAVAAALINTQGSLLEDGSWKGVLALGCVCCGVAVMVQPVVALPFRCYRIIDNRRLGQCVDFAYAPDDLDEYEPGSGEPSLNAAHRRSAAIARRKRRAGRLRGRTVAANGNESPDVGVLPATLAALDAITFPEDDEGGVGTAAKEEAGSPDDEYWTVVDFDAPHDSFYSPAADAAIHPMEPPAPSRPATDETTMSALGETAPDALSAAGRGSQLKSSAVKYLENRRGGGNAEPSSVRSAFIGSPGAASDLPGASALNGTGSFDGIFNDNDRHAHGDTTDTLTRRSTPEATLKPAAGDSTTDSAASEAGRVGRRDVQTHVVVDASSFTRAGYGLALGTALVLTGAVVSFTQTWCAIHFDAFWQVVAAAAIADVSIGQGLLLVTTAAWHWVKADEDEDEADDTDGDDDLGGAHDETGSSKPTTATTKAAAAKPLFELHPINGQWRHVGPLL